jgi:hypothetical protein
LGGERVRDHGEPERAKVDEDVQVVEVIEVKVIEDEVTSITSTSSTTSITSALHGPITFAKRRPVYS